MDRSPNQPVSACADAPRATHVIFDLDGTLLNTLDDLACAGNHLCRLHGWPTYSTDAYRRKVGNGMPKLVERLMPDGLESDRVLFEQAYAEFTSYYDRHKEDRTAPYPGISHMLEALYEAGVVLAVLTNKDHAAAQPLVARYFDPALFACVQGRVDGLPPKPAAPLTLRVMRQIGGEPQSSWYVGDSDVDVMCGHNAGLRVIGASWGFRGEGELRDAGADYLATAPADVTRIVLGS